MSDLFDWRKHLPVHPAADLFPLMSEQELKDLAEDIKEWIAASDSALSSPLYWDGACARVFN
jgi:hypothetical protein